MAPLFRKSFLVPPVPSFSAILPRPLQPSTPLRISGLCDRLRGPSIDRSAPSQPKPNSTDTRPLSFPPSHIPSPILALPSPSSPPSLPLCTAVPLTISSRRHPSARPKPRVSIASAPSKHEAKPNWGWLRTIQWIQRRLNEPKGTPPGPSTSTPGFPASRCIHLFSAAQHYYPSAYPPPSTTHLS